MKVIQNTEPNISPLMMQQNIIQNKDKMSRFNQLYDDDFISLINGLSDSIKEYYKVSRNNIKEANSFLSFYEHEGKSIQLLMDQIINSNSYQRVNEVFQQIPKINKIMSELKLNTKSNELNLNLFFDDAKILFKRMKLKRKEKILELQNSNSNNEVETINNNQGLNDSFDNTFNINQSRYTSKYNLINKNKGNSFSKKNQNNNSRQNSDMHSINNIYSQIMKLLNSFSEFNFMISKMNFEASNKYSNLQNNIKKEMDILMNLVKNNFSMNNQNKMLNSIKSFKIFSEDLSLDNRKSKSIPKNHQKENERLKQINFKNEKKIKDLNNQLNTFRINNSSDTDNIIRELKLKNNNLNLKLMKAEQQIKEKDDIIMNISNNYNNNQNNLMNINNNINLNNNLKQKDNIISNLQQQLYVYQNNENLLNNQITDLNNQFQTKINQYESQISLMNNKCGSLSQMLTNKNKDILKFQNENNEYKKEIDQLKKLINKQRLSNPNNNIIDEYKERIQRLQNDLNYYQNMLNQYENQIMELSNNNNNDLNSNYNIENNNFVLQKKIEMLNRELQMKENEFKKEKEMITNQNSLNEQKINAMNTQNHKIIEEQKMKINQLNKEIINYQKKEKAFEENNIKYIKQIEDMNNNIINTNKIMEQKDELIKQLNEKKNIHFSPDINNDINNNNINLELKKERDDYKFQFEQMQKKYISTKELLDEKNLNSQQNNNVNTNDMLKLKLTDMELENERLRKEINELKINNNNILLNEKIIDGNNIQNNNNYLGNNEFITKIKELTLENQKYKESLSATKENITKLESDINKKNEELEGLKVFIFKLQAKLEQNDDYKNLKEGKKDQKKPENIINMKRGENENLYIIGPNGREKNNNDHNKSFEAPKDANTAKIGTLLNKLNDSEKTIGILQNKIKDLQYQLEDKQVEKEISGYRTEDVNFSNYEEEFDLKKMVNGARDKNRSEDINIDYPGVQGIKDKYRELLQNMNMLEEQVKILICNINCNNKIKPQITQICQLMRIPPKNIQLIIAGKDKKKALGLIG